MNIPFYHLDTFTNQPFSGNAAIVCVLSKWLADTQLNAIANENNMPVTAFILPDNDTYEIRWITPEYELDLCGHGSLAAAYVIFNFLQPSLNQITLKSRHELLTVERDNEFITLNFPAKQVESSQIPGLSEGLGLAPLSIYQYQKERCLAVFHNETAIKHLKPDMSLLRQLPHRGVIVTAPGDQVDFVSRTFYPHKLISEDAVTGASHCLLVPYWAECLNKKEMHAKQLSKREGELFCKLANDRVLLSGRVRLYAKGNIDICDDE